MVEPPVKENQLAKTLKPSRLRNEIRPDSSNDEKSLDTSYIQIPDSDTVIQETQLDSMADNGTDDGLDTASQALTERTKASKALGASPPSPMQVRMLTREDSSSSTPAFSFGQPRKVLGRTNLKAGLQDATPIVIPDGVERGRSQSLKVGGTNATIVARPPLETSVYVKNDPFIQDSIQRTDVPPHSFQVTNRFHHEPDAQMFDLQECSSSTHPSAQPRPIEAPKKIRVVRKSRKNKNTALLQRRSDTWPPQSNIDEQRNSEAAGNAVPIPDMFASFPKVPPAEQRDIRPIPTVEENESLSSTAPEHVGNTQDSVRNASQAPIDMKSQHEMETLSAVQRSPQMVTSNVKVESSQPTVSAQSSAISMEQLPTTVKEQSSRVILKKSTAPRPECASQLLFVQGAVGSVPEASCNLSQQTYDASKSPILNPEQTSQLPRDSDAVLTNAPLPREDNLVLHKTANQDSSHRVSKPRKRIRAPAGPMVHLNQGPSFTSNFDQFLDNIRIAHHAEQLRVQHEHKQAVKHHEETATALRELISLQNNNIAEWKEKHQGLRDLLTRLTDKAKTNQKYATGLQNDYEKLQKSASAHHDQAEKILREKIREVEQEKESLQKEFEGTLAVLDKGRRNLKATVEDLYTRLVISDSKKRDLVESLTTQNALYKAECKKREELEKKLASSIQSIQGQLSNISTTLIDKLKTVQSSIDGVPTKAIPDPRIEDCLKMLQNLQTTPFLTAKDIIKAEGMLRSVHERFDVGFNALTDNIENKHLPTDEIRICIKSQLDVVRADQIKYDEAVSENRKAGEANKTLKMQLLAQERVSQDLEGSIKEFRLKEIDLKAQLTQLQSELNEVKAAAHEVQPSELEQTFDLRQRAEKAENCLAAVQNKMEQVDRLRLQVTGEVAKYKKMYDACRAKLLEVAKHAQCHHKSNESFAEMRMNISKDHQKKFNEMESGYKNEIHRITIERDDNEEKYQAQLRQANAAKDQMHDLRTDVKAITAELQIAHGENDEMQAKLKTAQQTAQASHHGAAEIAKLKERLQQKVEEMNSMKQKHATFDREHVDLKDKAACLQNSYDQSQAQAAQHLSTIEALRKDSATQLIEAKNKAQMAVNVVQDQASTLRKEKETLVSELEQARSTQTKLEAAQKSVAKERDGLKQQVAMLQATRDTQDAEVVRIQAGIAEEKRTLVEGHRSEIEGWKRRFEQSDMALKEAEAQTRRMEAEHRAKLESDKKETESRFQLVAKKYKETLQKARMEGAQSYQQAPHSPFDGQTSTRSFQNISAGNNRKKVHRQNHSVLNAVGSLSAQFDNARHAPTGHQPGLSPAQRQDSEFSTNLFDGDYRHDFGSEDLVDGNDLSLVEPDAETVPETQLMTGPTMSLVAFDEDLSRGKPEKVQSRGGSSTDLSIMGSDDLTELGMSTRDISTPMLCGRDLNSANTASEQKHRRKSSMRIDDISMIDSRSSQSAERPRSQANTASRMMPPPEFTDQYSKQHNSPAQHTLYKKPSQKRRGNANSSGASSPDFMHAQHDSDLLAREHAKGASRSSEQGHSRKRKTSMSPNDPDSAFKKQRTSSHAYPAYTQSSDRNEVSHSILNSRSKANPKSAQQASALSRGPHSRNSTSSSSIQPRKSSQGLSSDVSQSRARDSSSPHSHVADRGRRSSVRLTKKGRGGNGDFDDRFNQELNGH